VSATYREARQAVIKAVLVDNWYRITRYEDSEQAGPALENVAAEIEKALRGIPAR
jgi:hypothetical protein